ncbi:hypothetical protein ACM01_44680 [Streptomyces viridochromogenes]|uniref:Uncharacterized protein n=1 Tax=Streptomyces viridochromogenes TaxID=1938 RepID=A0A0J7YTV4_STRVR|nr:hypothetical protein [Streptomyces viridochromogenes]KMS66877.1 hypothetical protein ACM01_44680 [Streptomyces viridochromogenes]KOG25906.1 hypothetical protein ADK36_04715 [Streptomyces viridochromogenes]KOG26724.1 hypothetical protein ADK35_06510 [Streptomyces viridochromogenes]
MSARMHTPPHPASSGRADIRLPWWALALPTLAFITLLMLIINPSDAHAATAEPAITQLFERIQQLITR